MARHLVGLQAQENLPPYLSLAARLTSFDPHDVTAGLEDRSLVRFLTMRGTVHLLVADDALMLRQWTAPVHEREIKISQSIGPARDVDREAFLAALSALLDDGPQPQKALGAALAERFPDVPATQLGQLARSAAPLVQCPPRGTWQGSGGVVYQYVDRWLGRPLVEPDVEEIVRRYLRAFGPATAADVTAWSGVTRLVPVVKAMDDLVTHEDEQGKPLYDVPGLELADEDTPAPVRLLGQYDNVWLSHAGRDRVTTARVAEDLDGRERRDGQHPVRRRHAGRPVAGHRRPRRGPLHRPDRSRSRRSPSSTTRSPGSTSCWLRLAPAAGAATAARRRRPRRRWTCAAPRHRGGRCERRRRRTPRAPPAPARPRDRRRGPPGRARSAGSGSVASSWRTTASGALAIRAATSAVDASGVTSGNHARRACFAASRAVACHLASDFAARSPRQTATDRAAAHGTIRATPISVSTSTASSPRSPFGRAWTTTTSGTGSRHGRDRADDDVEAGLPGRGHLALGDVARAVGQQHGLTDREAAYGDRMVRLGAVDGDRCADVHAGQRRHQVDVQGHQRDISAG